MADDLHHRKPFGPGKIEGDTRLDPRGDGQHDRLPPSRGSRDCRFSVYCDSRRRSADHRRRLAAEGGYSLSEGWIPVSVPFYLLTGVFWLPVVWMQMCMRGLAAEATAQGSALPRSHYRLFYTWFAFGFPAFAAVLTIFWLMVTRPAISL
jgi:Predicted integral membrane protein (DUF2269)